MGGVKYHAAQLCSQMLTLFKDTYSFSQGQIGLGIKSQSGSWIHVCFMHQVTVMNNDRWRVEDSSLESQGMKNFPVGPDARAVALSQTVIAPGILWGRKTCDFWSHTDPREMIWIPAFDTRRIRRSLAGGTKAVIYMWPWGKTKMKNLDVSF